MRFRHAEPASAPREAAAPGGLVVERPPAGLARGKYAASATTIVAIGAALLLATIAYFYFRLRRARS